MNICKHNIINQLKTSYIVDAETQTCLTVGREIINNCITFLLLAD